MDKSDFEKLEILEQIEYINKLMHDDNIGYTKACSKIGVSRNTIKNKFLKIGYHYNDELKKIVAVSSTPDGKSVQVSKPETAAKSNKAKDKYNIDDIAKEIDLLKSKFLDLEQRLDNKVTTVTQSNIHIDKSSFGNVIKPRTVKFYDKVIDAFDEFSEDHKEFNKQDLYNYALSEFLKSVGKM